MKRLFYVLLIIPILFSCSSDDDEYDINEATAVINVEDFHPTTYDLEYGYYYAPEKVILLTMDKKAYATDGTCPVYPSNKRTLEYRYTINESSNKIENFHIACTSCNAEFDVNSGKALNDKSKRESVGIYKAKIDVSDTSYGWSKFYIWK